MRNRNIADYCRFWFLLCPLLSAASVSANGMEPQDSVVIDLSYRKVDKADYNGSVYVVKGDDLLSTATTFLTEDLMGIVPGMMFRQNEGGLENGNASYWIRGARTFNEGILVLVDGVERAFGSLTAEEVESIQVLKDASATGIYGMRAANGALLITTKKGVSGKPVVDFSAQIINQTPLASYDPLGGGRLCQALQYRPAI